MKKPDDTWGSQEASETGEPGAQAKSKEEKQAEQEATKKDEQFISNEIKKEEATQKEAKKKEEPVQKDEAAKEAKQPDEESRPPAGCSPGEPQQETRKTELQFIIRTMTAQDAETVMDVWKGLKGLDLTEADTPEGLKIFLDRNPGFSAVATVADGRIIGTLLCGHDGRRGYLYHVAVKAEFQRQGAGKALIEYAVKRLQAAGLTRCNVAAPTNKREDKEFWLHNGWDELPDLVLVQKKLG